mgnify:CR=1 FL=1
MVIFKNREDAFAAKVTFEYQGSGGLTTVGVGLARRQTIGHGNPIVWASDTIALPIAGNWTPYQQRVYGTIPNDAPFDTYDALKSVSPQGATDPLQNWDDDQYIVTANPRVTLSAFNFNVGDDEWIASWRQDGDMLQDGLGWRPLNQAAYLFIALSTIFQLQLMTRRGGQLWGSYGPWNVILATQGPYIINAQTGDIELAP